MHLKTYMSKPDNLVAREQLLFHRLMFDLKLEAAKVGHSLLAATPEVDRDGYDVALWLNNETTVIQCKAFAGRAPSRWRIHKKLISPSPWEQLEILHRGRPYTHCGFGGGVVAIAVQASEADIEIGYYFANLITIWAMSEGIVTKKKDVRKTAEAFLDELLTDEPLIEIPRSLLISSRTNGHLMALMGLEATVPHLFNTDLRRLLVDSNSAASGKPGSNKAGRYSEASAWIQNLSIEKAAAGLRDCSADFL